MAQNLENGLSFPMSDGLCQQCEAHVLFVRTEEEARAVRETGIMEDLGAVAVFVCNGEMATCPICGHEHRLPQAGLVFGPQHPVCPSCGHEFAEYDLAQCQEGALCLGAPVVVDGEPCFTIIVEIRCDCGHVLNFDPRRGQTPGGIDTMEVNK